MSKILLKGRPYGGSTTVTDALHLLTKDTLNTDISAQNMLTNILGDIAQLETSTAATKAYAKGEYLVLGSYFYKVTATIDPGDTLTVGTNIERTNVGAEVSALNSNWSLLKSNAVKQEEIALPENFSEIFLKATPSKANMNWFRCMEIPSIALDSTYRYFYSGDHNGTASGAAQLSVLAKKDKVYMGSFIDNGADISANASMNIYVR